MKLKGKSGVTLVELMVAAALASLVLGSAMGIWSYSRRNLARTATRQMLQQDATRILTQLKADLKAAKSETFKASENPMTLEFTRYVVDQNDNTKLSAEKTEQIRYQLTKPILRRAVAGKAAKTMSNSVENIIISRKALSETQKETDAYLEARVDIALEMGNTVPGAKIEERYSQHTSVVIRDEFYSLVNKDRQEIFEVAKEVAQEISKPGDSQFFNDQLDADSLKSLTDEQLTDLDKTQETNLKDAKKGIEEINSRISDVDTGKKWWQGFFFGLGANEEGAEVKELRDKLEDIECPDKDIPAKGSGDRASEKAKKIADELDEKIKELDKEFITEAFKGQTLYDVESTNDEEKKKAEQQRRAYDMKVMDRQIEKAVAQMSEEDRKKAEEANELPKKMIDQFNRSEEEIRKEIESSGIVAASEIDAMVAKEVAEANFLKSQYNSCDLTWMDSSDDQNKIKAYDAAKQLKNLADSKKETLTLKEMAIDNKAEIARARELKKESLTSES
ncbi:MAG: prepilin-type N-terminal cleavage/methylation domain-containing protein [Candidatus Riflebacteria bacterium]|nr:prepilin-type N-terminal cleavage/methylation domain-containing protein [Candidatus Riflebacteria bacterium]